MGVLDRCPYGVKGLNLRGNNKGGKLGPVVS